MGASYGFDTDNLIQNVASSAKSKFGTGVFYLRYFNPSPVATHLITASGGTAELRSGWDYGVRYLVPNSEPTQSRLNGTAAMGSADASAFCSAMFGVWAGVASLELPTNGRLDVYLSLESAVNLSTAYWNGWANYVGSYEWNGTYPLYPGLYCNPGSSAKNCSSLGASSSTYWCYSIWSSEHEPCAACGTFGSQGWDAETCYNSPADVGPTLMWQMAEEGVCKSCKNTSSWPNVDADMSNPSYTESSHMMYLASRP